jgi:Fe/S biogenesis protein NfuA
VRIMVVVSTVVEPIVKLTDAARTKITEVRGQGSEVALWISVSGVSSGAYTYTMDLQPLDGATDDDVIQRHDDLCVVIPAGSIDRLAGATLDFTSAGMVMDNPNHPSAASPQPERPQADLSGEVPQKVLAVLENEINPAIAAHGGYAELVAVEGDIAYVRMGGGCQGCGLAAVTLSEGIEVAILDSIPEITQVIDTTDHASGANPYYEAAKK